MRLENLRRRRRVERSRRLRRWRRRACWIGIWGEPRRAGAPAEELERMLGL